MAASAPLLQKGNTLLWSVLGLLGTFVVGYFYVLPAIKTLKSTRLAASALAADAQSLQTTINQVTATDQQLGSHQAALDRLALAVPAKPALGELMVSLGAIASASGVVLPTVQPLTTATGSSGTGVSLTIRGSYSGIHLFLDQLQKNLRPINVTQLTLSSTSNVAGASLVSASMQLVAARAQTTSPISGASSSTPSPPSSSSTTGPNTTATPAKSNSGTP